MIKHKLTVVTDTDDEETIENIGQIIQEHGFNIITVEDDGKKRLAFPIREHEYAFFTFYRLTVDGTDTEAPEKLARALETYKPILRFLLVKTEPTQ